MKSSHLRQYLAAFVSSLSVLSGGASFAWTTPLLPRLQGEGAEVLLTHEDVSWVVSLIEVGNLFSPIPAAFLADRLGRKPLLLSVAPVYVITWLLVLFTRTVGVLYLIRILQGAALGLLYAILPMYLGEVAEPALRGTVSIFFVAMEFLGILLVFTVGPYVSYQTLTWICFIPPVIFGATFWYFPESPQFLLMRNRVEAAEKSLMWLRGATVKSEVEEELQEMMDAAMEEKKEEASWRDILMTKEGRKGLFLMQIIVMTVIMSGFTAVLSYATDTFDKTGIRLMEPHVTTIVIGVISTVVLLGSGVLVDRAGRRPIILVSSMGAVLCLSCTSLYFYLADETSVDLNGFHWVPYVTLIGFVAVINFGPAAMLATLQAELFPNSTRGIASGITSVSICALSFIVLYIYIPIQDGVGLYLIYAIYAGFTALGTVLLYYLLPETKGKTFEEIQDLL